MNPGELDRLIVLQEPTESQKSANYEVVNAYEAKDVNVWAKIEFGEESEQLTDEGLQVYSRADFTIRFKRINENWRVKYDNKTYNINSIKPVEGRRNYIELNCESTSITNFKT